MNHSTTQRTIRRGLSGAGAAAVLVPGIAVGVAHAAPAATVCSGTIANRVIAGNVTVAKNATCTLKNVTVKGDVVYSRDGSRLTLTRAKVQGGLKIADPDLYEQRAVSFTAADSEVSGAVVLDQTRTVTINRSRFNAGARIGTPYCWNQTYACHPTTTSISTSRFDGDLFVGLGTSTLAHSTVGGTATFNGSATVRGSSLNTLQQFAVEPGAYAFRMGSSTVKGDATLNGALDRSPIRLGDGGNRFKGDLTVTPFNGRVTMLGNVVDGKASADGTGDRTLELKGTGNRFRGGTSGYFTTFARHQ